MSYTVSMSYGSQSFRSSSAKINIFVKEPDKSIKKEFPKHKMEQISSVAIPASPAGSSYGMFYDCMFAAKGGEIVMLKASTTRNRSPWSDGVILIRLRENAPLITIKVNLPNNRLAAQDCVEAFHGRGDIINKEDFDEFGIALTPAEMKGFTDEEEIEELFTINTLRKGTEKPRMIEVLNNKGEKVSVPEPKAPTRRVRIRR